MIGMLNRKNKNVVLQEKHSITSFEKQGLQATKWIAQYAVRAMAL